MSIEKIHNKTIAEETPLEDLAKKYLSFCEDVVSATLLNPDLQAKMQALTLETLEQFSAYASAASPSSSQSDDSSE